MKIYLKVQVESFASSQTNKLSSVGWDSWVFPPWWWRWWSRGAADPGGHRQEHQRAAVQEGGGDGWSWDQHAERHPRFQVKKVTRGNIQAYFEGLSSRCSLTGLQAAVSMTTCSSITCLMPKPYSRSTFSITTLTPSSPWPKSCIQGTISPM